MLLWYWSRALVFTCWLVLLGKAGIPFSRVCIRKAYNALRYKERKGIVLYCASGCRRRKLAGTRATGWFFPPPPPL
ncbi:uncharacterized protein LY79DRAFT_32474 [Colletotrichum navitas]|uniref:Uncharacterized protein n=1 Tax=Colletotrichum navitas TaxID=681940 RepID=A0AAD8V8D8_9PEZI|nr:uncharacterized protein LY79DRAFT_32474 [Colletotrichum navitas]KAK1596824.1 hypothetical protein LY79DRAFT_32474 [Colletotrichum navitas]